jgi:ATP-binding cassette subfamily B protein
VQEQFSLLTEFARATLVSVRLIKAYTLERFQEGRFQRLGQAYVRSNLKVATVQGLLFPIATLVGNVGMLLLLYYGGALVIEGAISIGSFVAFVSYLYMLIWPMMAVGWVANLAQRGITSMRRITGCSPSSRCQHQADRGPAAGGRHRLRMPATQLTYGEAIRPALRDLNLEIGPAWWA